MLRQEAPRSFGAALGSRLQSPADAGRRHAGPKPLQRRLRRRTRRHGPKQGRPALDEAAKARWRQQAIDWLKADLAFWSKTVENGPPQAKAVIAQTLQHWKADADVAGIRDAVALPKLPAAEQAACRALWADVDALLAKVSTGKKP